MGLSAEALGTIIATVLGVLGSGGMWLRNRASGPTTPLLDDTEAVTESNALTASRRAQAAQQQVALLREDMREIREQVASHAADAVEARAIAERASAETDRTRADLAQLLRDHEGRQNHGQLLDALSTLDARLASSLRDAERWNRG